MKKIQTVVILILLPLSVSAAKIDVTELLLLIRDTELNCVGAADVTRKSIANNFFSHIGGKELTVPSAVIEDFEEGKISHATSDQIYATGIGYSICQHSDIESMFEQGRYTGYRFIFNQRDGPVSSLIYTHGFDTTTGCEPNGGACGITGVKGYAIEAEMRYQDTTLAFLIYTNDASVIAPLRKGGKVSFTGTIVGISKERYGSNKLVGLVLQSMKPETRLHKCANGHEYAPTSGYKFCPIDGLPVN